MKQLQLRPVILVTGASRGFGRASALSFAQRGARVIAVVRCPEALLDLQREAQALGASIDGLAADLASTEQIDRIGEFVGARYGVLDVFVANAAILHPHQKVADYAAEDWRAAFSINVEANARLISLLDPYLRRAKAPCAIFVSSNAARPHSKAWPPLAALLQLAQSLKLIPEKGAALRPQLGPYGVSKAALEALAMIYAAESDHVRVMVVDPGRMRTDMRALAMPHENPEALPTPDKIAEILVGVAADPQVSNGARIKLHQHRVQAMLHALAPFLLPLEMLC